MTRELWLRVCLWPTLVRDRLIGLWYTFDRSALLVGAVPVVVFGTLGGLARFAYLEHQEMRAAEHRRAELRCLAENVYYEGRGEPLEGQYAVAEVTLNRVRSPRFPDTVCAVVHERRLDPLRGRYVGAFSWTELELRPPAGPAWQRAREVAEAAYDGEASALVPEALYYHAASVTPRWAREKTRVARIGRHVFYQ